MSQALQVEIRSQAIRIEEIPDFDAISGALLPSLSRGSVCQTENGKAKAFSGASKPKGSRQGWGRPHSETFTTGQQMFQFISLHMRERGGREGCGRYNSFG